MCQILLVGKTFDQKKNHQVSKSCFDEVPEKSRKREETAEARMRKKRQRVPRTFTVLSFSLFETPTTSDPPISSDRTSPVPPTSEPPRKRRKYVSLKNQTPEETRVLYQCERKEHMYAHAAKELHFTE